MAYVAAFLVGHEYFKYLNRKHPAPNLTDKAADNFLIWIVFGVILGGRLGYVLFYNFSFYLSHPEDILKTWEGGMSFHGGLLGVILAVILFSKMYKVRFIDIMDRAAPAFPIGIFFGRIANFINSELYGRTTDSPLGIIFPTGGPLPRHPSQLYEALFEGLILFLILHLVSRKNITPMRNSGIFLCCYATFRFALEYVRMPDAHLQEGIYHTITMGQILCIPMFMVGALMLKLSCKKK